MTLSRVQVRHLRCLEAVDLALHPRRNFLVGANGAGKTSFLEAIFVLGRGRSFRVRDNRVLVARGSGGFRVTGVAASQGREWRLGVDFDRRRLALQIDSLAVERLSEVQSILTANVIDPAAHELVSGGPGQRRRFLDWGVFHVEPSYLPLFRRFRRALSQRNAALQRGMRGSGLESWDEELIRAGEDIDQLRQRYLAGWGPLLQATARELLAAEVDVRLASGGFEAGQLRSALAASAGRDREQGRTHVGPHRAELKLQLEGAAARDVASRGQQKLLAAALLISQVRQTVACGRHPGVLLVDDPGAELDQQAVSRLFQVLEALPVQLVVTGVAAQSLRIPTDSAVFHVEQGRIEAAVGYN